MNRRPVTSTHVAAIGWEDDVLEVEFVSGHIYQYHEVPESEYRALLGASSIGRQMGMVKGRYQTTKLK